MSDAQILDTSHKSRAAEAARARVKELWACPEWRADRLRKIRLRFKDPEYREWRRKLARLGGDPNRLPPMTAEQRRIYKKCKDYGCSRADSLKAVGLTDV